MPEPIDSSISKWCGLPDLNRYGLPHAPQTCASAYSAKAAYIELIYTEKSVPLYCTDFHPFCQ